MPLNNNETEIVKTTHENYDLWALMNGDLCKLNWIQLVKRLVSKINNNGIQLIHFLQKNELTS